jgi:hypothetical protein
MTLVDLLKKKEKRSGCDIFVLYEKGATAQWHNGKKTSRLQDIKTL